MWPYWGSIPNKQSLTHGIKRSLICLCTKAKNVFRILINQDKIRGHGVRTVAEKPHSQIWGKPSTTERRSRQNTNILAYFYWHQIAANCYCFASNPRTENMLKKNFALNRWSINIREYYFQMWPDFCRLLKWKKGFRTLLRLWPHLAHFWLVREIVANNRMLTTSLQSKVIARMTLHVFGKPPHYSNGVYSVKLKIISTFPF